MNVKEVFLKRQYTILIIIITLHLWHCLKHPPVLFIIVEVEPDERWLERASSHVLPIAAPCTAAAASTPILQHQKGDKEPLRPHSHVDMLNSSVADTLRPGGQTTFRSNRNHALTAKTRGGADPRIHQQHHCCNLFSTQRQH